MDKVVARRGLSPRLKLALGAAALLVLALAAFLLAPARNSQRWTAAASPSQPPPRSVR
jgi:hypothetical protein